MITLIIFLCPFLFFLFILFKKIKINFELNIKEIDYILNITFFSKKNIRKGNVLEFFRSGEGKFDLEIIKEISSLINVNRLNTQIELGTEFIFLTNILTVFLSTIIPMLYNYPMNRKKNLLFDIKPYYDRFVFIANINAEIELTLLDIFIIYLHFKRK